ncbi:MAG: hypothetical protein H0U58_02055 [Chloroflexi bacterium]|nr:hypothetical protein [Chloroflexota bacterium]
MAAFIGSPPAVLVSAPMEAAGGVRARIGPWTVCLPDNLAVGGDRVVVGLRPEAFIEPGGPTVTGAVRPLAPVRVIDAEPLGAVTNVSFQVDIEPVTVDPGVGDGGPAPLRTEPAPTRLVAQVDGRRHVQVGDALELDLDVSRLLFFNPADGRALSVGR